MYKEYQEAKKTEIIIWCDGWAKTLPSKSVSVKRKCVSESNSKKKPRMTSAEINSKTLDEVDMTQCIKNWTINTRASLMPTGLECGLI